MLKNPKHPLTPGNITGDVSGCSVRFYCLKNNFLPFIPFKVQREVNSALFQLQLLPLK